MLLCDMLRPKTIVFFHESSILLVSWETKFRSDETINMASVSSHIDLKNRVSDFWHMGLLFLQENKVCKGNNKSESA